MIRGMKVGTVVGVIGLLLALVTLVVTVTNPEIRQWLGLDSGRQESVTNYQESEPIRLTNDPDNEIQPSFSADGQFIVYTADGDGNSEIYTMHADGLIKERKTHTDVSEDVPSFSPDGRYILFGARYDGNEEIYVMALNGSQKITNISSSSASDEGRPRFSAKGDQVFFDSNRSGNWEIYVAEYKNEELISPKPITDKHDLVNRYPVISETANPVLFRAETAVDEVNKDSSLFSIQIDGSNLQKLTEGPKDMFPSVTADGNWVVFSSSRDGNFDIYALEITSGQIDRLTDHPADDSFPSVSKDGHWIVFASNRDDTGYDLYKMPFRKDQ